MIDNDRPTAATELVQAKAGGHDATIEHLSIGLTWTSCRTRDALGLAMSPGGATRLLPWPGTIAGRRASEVAAWLASWDPFEATVGLAAANALINAPGNSLMQSARPLSGRASPNLAVFEHFRPWLEGRRIVVVGRYPGLDEVMRGLDVTVLERNPTGNDLPDSSAEFVVPEADWVFLTATTLINKTFPRLAALSRQAVTVLMGPSTPWLAEWADFGIDFLAGVQVVDGEQAGRIAMEGGGTRLFGDGVRYAVADIGQARLAAAKAEIAATAARREALKAEMEAWYGKGGGSGRFPRWSELEAADAALSRLDTLYKRLWDGRRERPVG